MNSLVCYGLRGGVGTTSVVAALGFALHALGEKVLLVDLTKDNILGMHFNCPLSRVENLESSLPNERLWQVVEGLQVLTSGLLVTEQNLDKQEQLHAWLAQIEPNTYDWILFDAPNMHLVKQVQSWLPVTKKLAVTNVDSAAALLMHRHDQSITVLVNRFVPESRLQNDLLTMWQQKEQLDLVPVLLHADEAWNESLAYKLPVSLHLPLSQAAREVESLAVWCMAHKGD